MIRELKYYWINNLISKSNDNLMIPHSDYISKNNYPNRDTQLFNTWVTLKYRDHHLMNLQALDYQTTIKDPSTGRNISSRPNDDNIFIPRNHDGPEYQQVQKDLDYVISDSFRIIRADAEEPYRMVGINADYSVVLITTTEKENGNYIFPNIVSLYSLQRTDLVTDTQIYNVVYGNQKDLNINTDDKAYALRIDKEFPSQSVFIRERQGSNIPRVYLGDEVWIYSRYNPGNPIVEQREEDLKSVRQSIISEIFPN